MSVAAANPSVSNGAATALPVTTIESGSGGDAGDDGSMAAALRVLAGEDPPAEGGESPEAPAAAPAEEPAAAPEPAKDPEAKAKPAGWTEEDASKAFASLTAQEKRHKARVAEQTAELNVARDKHAQALAALDTRTKELEAREAELTARRERAKTKPLEALSEIGWTLAQLTKYVADHGAVPPEKLAADLKLEYEEGFKKLREEQERFRKEAEESKRGAEAAQQKRQAAEYETGAREAVVGYLKQYPQNFPKLSKVPAHVAQQKALDIQSAHYQANREAIEAGRENPLALPDAMLYAERQLQEITSWFSGDAGQAGANQPGAAKPETSPLSQADASTRTVTPPVEDAELDEEQRWQRALRELDGG